MEWINAAVGFISSLPIWAWAFFLAVMVGVFVDYLEHLFEVTFTPKPTRRHHLSATVGLGLLILAGAMAMIGPNILWVLGGVGLGLWLGRDLSPKTASADLSTTTDVGETDDPEPPD